MQLNPPPTATSMLLAYLARHLPDRLAAVGDGLGPSSSEESVSRTAAGGPGGAADGLLQDIAGMLPPFEEMRAEDKLLELSVAALDAYVLAAAREAGIELPDVVHLQAWFKSGYHLAVSRRADAAAAAGATGTASDSDDGGGADDSNMADLLTLAARSAGSGAGGGGGSAGLIATARDTMSQFVEWWGSPLAHHMRTSHLLRSMTSVVAGTDVATDLWRSTSGDIDAKAALLRDALVDPGMMRAARAAGIDLPPEQMRRLSQLLAAGGSAALAAAAGRRTSSSGGARPGSSSSGASRSPRPREGDSGGGGKRRGSGGSGGGRGGTAGSTSRTPSDASPGSRASPARASRRNPAARGGGGGDAHDGTAEADAALADMGWSGAAGGGGKRAVLKVPALQRRPEAGGSKRSSLPEMGSRGVSGTVPRAEIIRRSDDDDDDDDDDEEDDDDDEEDDDDDDDDEEDEDDDDEDEDDDDDSDDEDSDRRPNRRASAPAEPMIDAKTLDALQRFQTWFESEANPQSTAARHDFIVNKLRQATNDLATTVVAAQATARGEGKDGKKRRKGRQKRASKLRMAALLAAEASGDAQGRGTTRVPSSRPTALERRRGRPAYTDEELAARAALSPSTEWSTTARRAIEHVMGSRVEDLAASGMLGSPSSDASDSEDDAEVLTARRDLEAARAGVARRRSAARRNSVAGVASVARSADATIKEATDHARVILAAIDLLAAGAARKAAEAAAAEAEAAAAFDSDDSDIDGAAEWRAHESTARDTIHAAVVGAAALRGDYDEAPSTSGGEGPAPAPADGEHNAAREQAADLATSMGYVGRRTYSNFMPHLPLPPASVLAMDKVRSAPRNKLAEPRGALLDCRRDAAAMQEVVFRYKRCGRAAAQEAQLRAERQRWSSLTSEQRAVAAERQVVARGASHMMVIPPHVPVAIIIHPTLPHPQLRRRVSTAAAGGRRARGGRREPDGGREDGTVPAHGGRGGGRVPRIPAARGAHCGGAAAAGGGARDAARRQGGDGCRCGGRGSHRTG